MASLEGTPAKLETRTADIELTSAGIVYVRIRGDVDQTVSDAKENLGASCGFAQARRLRLLVDLSQARPLEAAVRHTYRGEFMGETFSALAFVVSNSPLGRMMGNVYLRVANLALPARLFSNATEAMNWLHSVGNV